MEKTFFIGSYTPEGDHGIWQARLDTEKGNLEAFRLDCTAVNPSWICLHPGGKTLYAVEENEPSGSVLTFQKTGNRWEPVSRLQAGSAPCHLALDDQKEFLFCSNYMDGTLNVFRLNPEGIPKGMTDTLRHRGKGARPDRQEGPHIHSSWYYQGYLYVIDLGLDRISLCSLNRESGTLTEHCFFRLPPASGPRHLALHPDFPDRLYVLAELNSHIYVVDTENGTILQDVPAVPDAKGEYWASSIRFAGNTLCTGCRGYDAVSLYGLRPDGLLENPTVYPHSGQYPRDVWLGENWCITADQKSGCLTLLRRNGYLLRETMTVKTGTVMPTCILEY